MSSPKESQLRSSYNQMSLRKKLVLLISLISLTIVSLSILASFFIELNAFKRRLLEEYTATARMIASNAEAAVDFKDPYDAQDIIDVLSQRDFVLTGCIYLDSGEILATYRADKSDETTHVPAMDAESEISGKSIIATAPVIQNDQQIGLVALHADLSEVRSFLFQRSWMLVGLLALSTAIATYLAARIGRKLTQPVLDLAETADRISNEKDYSTRHHSSARDETATLVRAFNRMMAEIQSQEDKIIEEKERAEASSKAKEEFLSVISHELRTPLNPIVGYVDVLLGKHHDSDDRKQLSLIKLYAEHLQGLIDDILDYSRIERGTLVLNHDTIDYQQLCRNAIELLGKRAEKESVEIIVEHSTTPPSDSAPPYIKTDRLRIQQVLLNFISNALKFTDSGYIKIHSELDISHHPHGRLKISVEDSGIGIAPQNRDKVFEPFTQIEPNLTRKQDGLGLGLAITKKIVHALSGTIDFESQVGKGSTFWFEIPVEIAARPQPVNTDDVSPEKVEEYPKKRILLVDDQMVNRELGETLLESWGQDVTTACSGEESIDLFKAQPFDLVFMDIRMPKKDGYETAREIRKLENGDSRTPIVALTAHITNDEKDHEQHQEMDDFVSKPINDKKIKQILDKWLGSNGT